MRDSVSRTKATYRNLGNSGLRVSNPILGGLHLGSPKWFPWVLNEEQVDTIQIPCGVDRWLTYKQSLPILKAAYDRGINTASTFLIIPKRRLLTVFSGTLPTCIQMASPKESSRKRFKNIKFRETR